jgi:N-acetylmuramoyl-L-alanine amidase
LTLSPNPLNFSIKNKTDNVNPISCQVKSCCHRPDRIEKTETIEYKETMLRSNTQIPNFKIGHRQPKSGGGKNRSIYSRNLTAVLLLGLLIFSLSPTADAKEALFEAHLPVVVIDPGHGGIESGAQGPDGTSEKTVTLNLARMIAEQLETRCQVVLTRSDDYRLDISGRTAVANQSGAALFISLHTGASFSRSISGSTVYYYRQFIESALTAAPEVPPSLSDSSQPISWDQIQTKYHITSEKLAIFIQNRLNDVSQTPDTKLQGAPLLVLEGADMPAVAVEIGNLSNPNEEKKLGDSELLAGFARAIAEGVEAFLSGKSP